MLTNILLGLILITLIIIIYKGCLISLKSLSKLGLILKQLEAIYIRLESEEVKAFRKSRTDAIMYGLNKQEQSRTTVGFMSYNCDPVPCNKETCEPAKPKRTFKRPDIDPALWRTKFDEMLEDKAKTLKSDNKVFADHHIDRQRFKALATPEQRTRHAELQVLCKAKGREKIAETMGRGAKKKG